MCANFDNLKDEAQSLEAAGATRLHLDVMDGQYVPNFALGLGDVKSVCRNTTIATEVHMMIQEPARFVQMFADAGVDIMYFHPDSASHPLTVVQKIRQTGKKPGIVINPEVTIESMLQFYDLVDNVLVMGVNLDMQDISICRTSTRNSTSCWSSRISTILRLSSMERARSTA